MAGGRCGRWPVAGGRWPMADGRWPVADGRWPVADGRWPMADGRWGAAHGSAQEAIEGLGQAARQADIAPAIASIPGREFRLVGAPGAGEGGDHPPLRSIPLPIEVHEVDRSFQQAIPELRGGRRAQLDQAPHPQLVGLRPRQRRSLEPAIDEPALRRTQRSVGDHHACEHPPGGAWIHRRWPGAGLGDGGHQGGDLARSPGRGRGAGGGAAGEEEGEYVEGGGHGLVGG
ncbi:MAG TPA: hypothetical protein ENK18_16725 [Deltaproteobacteria bacterium]|nr:hypothetical protein [Deltaproteobacteria bacterium]